MKDYMDILVGFGIAILTISIAVLLVMGIKKTEPSAASENANRFILEQVMYNRSVYLVTDTKTGAEYLAFGHGGVIKLEKSADWFL